MALPESRHTSCQGACAFEARFGRTQCSALCALQALCAKEAAAQARTPRGQAQARPSARGKPLRLNPSEIYAERNGRAEQHRSGKASNPPAAPKNHAARRPQSFNRLATDYYGHSGAGQAEAGQAPGMIPASRRGGSPR